MWDDCGRDVGCRHGSCLDGAVDEWMTRRLDEQAPERQNATAEHGRIDVGFAVGYGRGDARHALQALPLTTSKGTSEWLITTYS